MAEQTKKEKRALNNGQKTLLANYVGPAMDAFWNDDREAPDPEEFFSAIYNSHPEIEAALSGTIHQIFHGSLIVYTSAVIETATEIEQKGTKELLLAILTGERESEGLGGDVWEDFDVPENVQPYIRGLSSQFFFQTDSNKMPFWYRENNRIHEYYYKDVLSLDKLKKGILYTLQNTVGYEDSVDAPPGYVPYDITS